jgi:heat shock protein HslJ
MALFKKFRGSGGTILLACAFALCGLLLVSADDSCEGRYTVNYEDNELPKFENWDTPENFAAFSGKNSNQPASASTGRSRNTSASSSGTSPAAGTASGTKPSSGGASTGSTASASGSTARSGTGAAVSGTSSPGGNTAASGSSTAAAGGTAKPGSTAPASGSTAPAAGTSAAAGSTAAGTSAASNTSTGQQPAGTNTTAPTGNSGTQQPASGTPAAASAALAAISGKDWKLSEIRKGNVVTVIDRKKLQSDGMGDIFTLNVGERLTGKGAPNRFTAGYQAGADNSITVTPPASTLMASIYDPERIREKDYFQYLTNAKRWRLNQGKLEIYSSDASGKETVLVYVN